MQFCGPSAANEEKNVEGEEDGKIAIKRGISEEDKRKQRRSTVGHVVYTRKRKEIHYGHEKNRMQKCKEEEEEEDEEEEKEEKEEKVYKQKEPIPLRNLQARMQCKETELEPKRRGPNLRPEKTKQIHYFSFFLPQIDLALDLPAGLPPGTGDSGGGGGAGCCCFDASFRFSADVSSMYLGL
jgi:hypothetical protein